MSAYYNEINPFAAAWLRELIKKGCIADGDVDERDIQDVNPGELRTYTQCHFFAGIGVWSYALRQAGWADDAPVWTGSCPCQPFSAAGKGAGFADERHLWPAWHHLIRECCPRVVFGEQVASKDGLGWLDLVQTDLEAAGYASGAVDLCAAGVGAPHIRQRLWFVAKRRADADDEGSQGRTSVRERSSQFSVREGSVAGGVADPTTPRYDETRQHECGSPPFSPRSFEYGGMVRSSNSTNHHWRNADWLFCRDDKWRPVEPGTFPLVDGASARVGRLRGYGNAIVAPAAQALIEAAMDTI